MLASDKINERFLGLQLRLLPSCKNGNGKRLLSTEIRCSKPGSAKFEVHLIRAGANRSAACKWQLQIYFVLWMTCIYAAKIYSPIITPPPLWLHKKSLPWWVLNARSDKSSVAGAYMVHLRKILRLLPLAVNQQSSRLELSKSASVTKCQVWLWVFHLVSLSSLKSGATSSCSIFTVELLAVGSQPSKQFLGSQRSCARWRTELQRHLVSTAYKTSVKKVDWWMPEGFQLWDTDTVSTR